VLFAKPLGTGTRLNANGPGTVTVSAASPLSGTAAVTGGTLRFTESSGALGGVGGAITVDSTLEVENAGTHTFGNVLAGGAAGRFVKQGGGVLELTANHPFTGLVRIAAGTLSLAAGSSLAASRIEIATGALLDITPLAGFTLAPGQTLAGSGAVTGTLNAATDSVIDPGFDGIPGTLAFDQPLVWSGGVTAVFDLASTPPAAATNSPSLGIFI
jgi:autotransporter-associated beta strand protein